MDFDFSWMAPAILMLLFVGVHQAVKPWWAKAICVLVVFGLGIATLQAFFRGSNWGGIIALVLLGILWLRVWQLRRRRKQRHDKKSNEQHHHHHYSEEKSP
jgi:hypothetical protein